MKINRFVVTFDIPVECSDVFQWWEMDGQQAFYEFMVARGRRLREAAAFNHEDGIRARALGVKL